MPWRIWGFIFFIFLTGSVYGFQSGNQVTRPGHIAVQSNAPLLTDMAVLWLYVVKDGEVTKISYSKKTLPDTGLITVDGYVSGAVLLSLIPVTATVNHNAMSPVEKNGKGYFKLKHFGFVHQDKFWSNFLSFSPEWASKQIQEACYARFPKIPGDALCDASEFRITIVSQGGEAELTVRQDPQIDLNTLFSQGTPERHLPRFYYLGKDCDQFSNAPAAFKKRIQAIISGIRRIETHTATPIVGRVNIIDYNGPYNAYTCLNENEIWLYSQLFWNETTQDLEIMAQHETLHILSDRLGLPDSEAIRFLYKKLKNSGYDEENGLGIKGAHGPGQSASFQDEYIFDFINESNFVPGANGGHSQDSLDEFCVSFLHTLIFVDRLERQIDMPIRSKNGETVKLSAAQKASIVETYRNVFETLITSISSSSPVRVKSFLLRCRATVQDLYRAFTTNAKIKTNQVRVLPPARG